MKKARFIPIITTMAIMAVIFMLSAQTRESSSELSTGITKRIVDIVASVTNMSQESKASVVTGLHNFVRKTAHFTLYAVLGFSASAMFGGLRTKDRKWRIVLYSIAFCCLYAASDELHQKFVSGRGPQSTDVMIDTVGAFFGSVLFLPLLKRWRRITDD